MDKTSLEFIPLPGRQRALIVYEDRNVLVIDKPAGWMLAPRSWTRTSRNLQRAIECSIDARQHWAKKRNLRFLRYVHRLDAETSGLLIMARNRFCVARFTQLFESGRVKKLYLAIVPGAPPESWHCDLALQTCKTPQPHAEVCNAGGKSALTEFKRLLIYSPSKSACCSVIAAEPHTGRLHQVRAHLAATGHPVLGDQVYAQARGASAPTHRNPPNYPIALRAIGIHYNDPFTGLARRITVDFDAFLSAFGVPRPLFETVANAVKNWPKISAAPQNTRICSGTKQDIHINRSHTNP